MPNDYSNLYGRVAAPPQGTPPQGEPPKPFTLDSADVDTPQGNFPPPPPQAPLYRQYMEPPRPAAPPPPPKVKKPFSPIPLLLIAGVAFLFLGGVIFLTSTWDVMPNAGRAVTLLSACVVAFAANILAERVFRLQKTGIAFYILGCIFLPLSLGGIGQFQLFGEWFSFAGPGRYLVWTVIGLSIAVSTWIGQRSYKSSFLAWVSLMGGSMSWSCLSLFAGSQMSASLMPTMTCSMWTAFAVFASVWANLYLRRHRNNPSPLSKVVLLALYPLLVLDLIGLVAMDRLESVPEAILAMILAVLFCNRNFMAGRMHLGVFGSIAGIFLSVLSIGLMTPFERVPGARVFVFACTLTALLLMACRLSGNPVMAGTYSIAGIVVAIPTALFMGAAVLFEHGGGWLLTLGFMIFLATIFFATEKKGELPKDAGICCLTILLVFLSAMFLATTQWKQGSELLFTLLLSVTALMLLAEAFFTRRPWTLMTAVAACGSVLLAHLPFPGENPMDSARVAMLWMFSAGFVITACYAHAVKRPLLEKSAAWVSIATILTAFPMMLDELPKYTVPVWILTLALGTLLYLLESVAFSGQTRTGTTKLYLEIVSAFGCFAAVMDFVSYRDAFDSGLDLGWCVLLFLLLGIFAVVFTAKRTNAAAILPLGLIYYVADSLIRDIPYAAMRSQLTLSENSCAALQVFGFAVVLGVFAAMGRFLVKEGMLSLDGKRFRMDFPLLLGVLPVLGAAVAIDWHPSILIFLFLTLYSLLYIGRLKHRRIPAMLASLFGCTTLLMHNAEDPFNIFALWHEWAVRTPQILLYLLPIHLFIFLQLWILPKNCRPGVHIARFCMYCITMACLLLSSMSFGNVADAIILVVFSFAILVGSFMVKRLRWFTLGFAVLVVMTIRLTWSFWTSLHWGIYLFLAGALLIVIASVYELKVRRATENPDAPKKSMNPFSAWRW